MEARRSVTTAQISALVKFLNENEDLVQLNNRTKEGRVLNKQLWDECAAEVNSKPGGARSSKEWAKYWSELKCRVKTKIALLNKAKNTNQNVSPLNFIERAVAAIIQRNWEPKEPLKLLVKDESPVKDIEKPLSPTKLQDEAINDSDSDDSVKMVIDLTVREEEDQIEDFQEEEDEETMEKEDEETMEKEDEETMENVNELEDTSMKKSPKQENAAPSTSSKPSDSPASTEELPQPTTATETQANVKSHVESSPIRPFIIPEAPNERSGTRAFEERMEQRRALLEQVHTSVHLVWTEAAQIRAESIANQAGVARKQAKAIANMSHALHRLIQIANKYYVRPKSE